MTGQERSAGGAAKEGGTGQVMLRLLGDGGKGWGILYETAISKPWTSVGIDQITWAMLFLYRF